MTVGSNQAVVLLVEDDLEVRAVVADILEDAGYHVDLASNGVQALDRLHQLGERPALVLLDLMMPVMNGWQFLEVFRAEGYTIPVVVLTAAQDVELPDDIPVLLKPIENARLLHTIRGKLR